MTQTKQQQAAATAAADEAARIRAESDQKEQKSLSKLTDRQLFAEARRTADSVKPIDSAFLDACLILNGRPHDINDPYCLRSSRRYVRVAQKPKGKK